MKLKSLNKLVCFLILTLFNIPSNAEEEIDILNNKKKETLAKEENKAEDINSTINSDILKNNKINNNITIEEKRSKEPDEEN